MLLGVDQSSAAACPLAILSTVSGTMHFYALEAFKIWMKKESEMVLQLNAHAHKSASLGDGNIGDPVAADEFRCSPIGKPVHRDSHDGFTLAQWVQHAKKKSSIASATCRLNGELKKRLDMYELQAQSRHLVPVEDPLFHSDPWHNAKLRYTSTVCPESRRDTDVTDPRSGWRRTISDDSSPDGEEQVQLDGI